MVFGGRFHSVSCFPNPCVCCVHPPQYSSVVVLQMPPFTFTSELRRPLLRTTGAEYNASDILDQLNEVFTTVV